MKIYTVTTIPADFPEKDVRCLGWYEKVEEAIDAIEHNSGDMNEDGHYKYAFIEIVESGIYTFPREEIWFKWIEVVGVNTTLPIKKYVKLDEKPNRFKQTVCFSMG